LAPRGVNAVEIAAELVARLRARARRFGAIGPFDRDFDPPHTTLQTGLIRGGTAVNIVPNFCSFDFELRCLPDDDPGAVLSDLRSLVDDQLLPEMRAVSAEAAITIEPISDYAPLASDGAGTAVELVEALLGTRAGKVSFATEAGYYQRAGIPTLVCGPGSIEQAHRPDEYVAIADLGRCETFLDATIRRLGERP
jgi:acetylornithine deacetylase